MGVGTLRRYKLLKAQALERAGEPGLADAYRAAHARAPGTPLPATFPHRDALAAAGYAALEDVDGAAPKELRERAGLDARAAKAAVAEAALALEARGPGAAPLPEGFPARDALVQAGYTTIESLSGHDALALALVPGVTAEDAEAVLAALEAPEAGGAA